MEKSKVYFTSFKATGNENLLQKLHRLMKTAGFENIDFKDKYAAIKIHFGEYGNLAFLRPNYAKAVADLCKAQGGVPFLTDCNTLYPGSRKNALEHLDCATLCWKQKECIGSSGNRLCEWVFPISDRMSCADRRWFKGNR